MHNLLAFSTQKVPSRGVGTRKPIVLPTHATDTRVRRNTQYAQLCVHSKRNFEQPWTGPISLGGLARCIRPYRGLE